MRQDCQLENKDTAKGYKKLLVWNKADELVVNVYRITNNFPSYELYGFTSQLRRAALSVAVNIVEGYGRGGKKELRNFLNIALGSLSETEYLLDLACRLGYMKTDEYNKIEEIRAIVGKLLWTFYRSLF